jgi:hypothetical protein
MTTLDTKALEAATAEWLNWTDRTAGEGLADHLARAITAYLDALSSLPAQAVGVKLADNGLTAAIVEDMRVKYSGNPAMPFAHRVALSNICAAALAALSSTTQPAPVEITDEVMERPAKAIAALFAPSQPAAVGVTDEMVERARAAHGAVFQEILQERTIDALAPERQEANDKRMMRAALEAALRSTP